MTNEGRAAALRAYQALLTGDAEEATAQVDRLTYPADAISLKAISVQLGQLADARFLAVIQR